MTGIYYLTPAVGTRAGPSLPARGTLSIGYGNGGGVPHLYFLRDEQNLDLGFLKLFISTQPIDLEGIPQASPFQPVLRDHESKGKRSPAPLWDAVTIAVVQRTPGSKLSAQDIEMIEAGTGNTSTA